MFNEDSFIEELRSCATKDDILKLFDKNNISNIEKKIKYLNKSMYNPETFYSSGDLDNEDKLDLTIEIFLMKDWKINEYYEKAGF